VVDRRSPAPRAIDPSPVQVFPLRTEVQYGVILPVGKISRQLMASSGWNVCICIPRLLNSGSINTTFLNSALRSERRDRKRLPCMAVLQIMMIASLKSCARKDLQRLSSASLTFPAKRRKQRQPLSTCLPSPRARASEAERTAVLCSHTPPEAPMSLSRIVRSESELMSPTTTEFHLISGCCVMCS
jgi:hypothetical protein